MKIFANKNIWKKIVIIFTLITSLSFAAPKPVAALFGGKLTDPICDLLIGIGDATVGIAHKYIIGQDVTIIKVSVKEDFFSHFKRVVVILCFVLVAAAVIAATAGAGAGISALAVKFGADVAKVSFITALATTSSTTILVAALTGGFCAAKVYHWNIWRDAEVVLPMYSLAPENIFSDKVDLFDVNFFDPALVQGYEYGWVSTRNEKLDAAGNAVYDEVDKWQCSKSEEEDKKREIDAKVKEYTGKSMSEFQESSLSEGEKKKGRNAGSISNENSEQIWYCQVGDTLYRLKRQEVGAAGVSVLYTLNKTQQVNFMEMEEPINSTSYTLRSIIAKWYVALRIIAIVGMMTVLVYTGIKILISSTASDKAKYKQLLGDWLVGMVLLFTMHYIMVFSNMAVKRLTEVLSSVNPTINTPVLMDSGGKIESALSKLGITTTGDAETVAGDGNEVVYKYEEGDNTFIEWHTNLMGNIRMEAAIDGRIDASEKKGEKTETDSYIGHTLMFMVMVMYMLIFIWTYLKRVIYMAFLTLIAPLVALTYPIDRANDGQAQGFNYWFKEYIFNLLLQPLHLLIYTILVSAAVELSSKNWIYTLVALGFIATSEKIVRQMFNFSKASTPGAFAGPAGMALTMTGMKWLFGHGPKDGKDKGGSGKGGGGDENSDPTKKVTSRGASGINDLMGAGAAGGESPQIPGQTSLDLAGVSGGGGGSNGRTSSINSRGQMATSPRTGGTGQAGREKRKGRFKAALKAGGSAYRKGLGEKFKRSVKSAKPMRMLGRLGMGAAGGALFGSIALSAGVAGGDPGKATQATIAGMAGGYRLGRGGFNAVNEALSVDGAGNAAERAYLGEKAYKEKYAEINQMKVAHEESTIRLVQEKLKLDREEAVKKSEEMARRYMDEKINDPSEWIDIENTIDKTGLTQDQAIAAQKIAKMYDTEHVKGVKEERDLIHKMRQDFDIDPNTAKAYLHAARQFDNVQNGRL